MTESAVYGDCVTLLKRLKSEGWQLWWTKTAGGLYQQSGLPDLLICCYGRFLGVELKRTEDGKEVARPKQVWMLGKIDAAGGLIGMLRSADELEALLWLARTEARR